MRLNATQDPLNGPNRLMLSIANSEQVGVNLQAGAKNGLIV